MTEHRLANGIPPAWADGWGEDRFGAYLVLRYGEAMQRLRWVPPGDFVMGSPKEEQGRFDREIEHRVTLTEGLWLGEVPCTQAFWEAVTGENPSRFQSPQRPVESVSFDRVDAFLDALQSARPEWNLRLPTEAEWEWACRAGTQAATYAGDLEILGGRNAPVLDPLAWYGGNSGMDFDLEAGGSADWKGKQHDFAQAGSRVVKGKRPNAWGLHDTLGNVWEWCSDRYGPYTGEDEVNPRGPAAGSGRVMRGGSWISNARFVRAAYRDAIPPDYRSGSVGFRLARGPS